MNTSQNTPENTPSDQSRPFGFWISAVDRLTAARFATAFEDEGVTRRDWRILNAVDGTVPSGRELPDRKLRHLADLGWIERTTEGWALTPDGVAAKARLSSAVEEIRAEVADVLGPEEFAALAASLEKLARGLGYEEGTRLPRRPHARRGDGHGRRSEHHGRGRRHGAHAHGHGFGHGDPFASEHPRFGRGDHGFGRGFGVERGEHRGAGIDGGEPFGGFGHESAGHDRFEHDRFGHDRFGHDRFGHDRSEHARFGHGRFGGHPGAGRDGQHGDSARGRHEHGEHPHGRGPRGHHRRAAEHIHIHLHHSRREG
jgi:hypothetical protein